MTVSTSATAADAQEEVDCRRPSAAAPKRALSVVDTWCNINMHTRQLHFCMMRPHDSHPHMILMLWRSENWSLAWTVDVRGHRADSTDRL